MASLRELNSARELRELREKDECEARELEMAPVREAEEENTRLLRELRNIELAAVNAGSRDPGFIIPESVLGLSMEKEEARQFNGREALKFRQNNPDFFNSRANVTKIIEYVNAQGVAIANEEMLRAVWHRLQDLGLLEQRPEPESIEVLPEPEQQPQLDPEVARLNRIRDYETKPVIEYCGKEYSERDLDLLSSDEYLRVMRVPRFRGELSK